ncbi:hypothetical protein ACGFZP_12995 [Kitasatospora sp. NPDC048239]|uniref:hypothetical protein n=1 Tax=Kitasatospora sp. NPDC048239 TaxID=3364046 RepID=UPI00371FA311
MTTPKRKAKPWAVVLNAPGGPLRTEHTSEAKAYEHVRAELAAARAGASRVTRIRVEQWDRPAGRWQLFDLIDPKEQQ